MEEIDQLDADIRLKSAEVISSKSALPVQPRVKTAPMINTKTVDKDDAFEGQSFTRMVIAKAVAKLQDISPVAVAKRRWGASNPTLVNLIKTAVEGGGSGTGEIPWGGFADPPRWYTHGVG